MLHTYCSYCTRLIHTYTVREHALPDLSYDYIQHLMCPQGSHSILPYSPSPNQWDPGADLYLGKRQPHTNRHTTRDPQFSTDNPAAKGFLNSSRNHASLSIRTRTSRVAFKKFLSASAKVFFGWEAKYAT